jgi:nucleoside phosphorylase
MDHIDVVIIAALPEELDAARTAGLDAGVERWQERDAGGTPYLAGEYQVGDRRLGLALARPTRMGGRVTAPTATALADLLSPSCLAMCGVCAGNPDITAPGDVVVAEVAYEYDEGRQTGSTFEGDHRQYPLDAAWTRVAQDFDPTGLSSYGRATDDEATIWFLERLHRRQDPRTHPARDRYFPHGTWQSRLEQLESAGRITFQPGEGWALTPAGTSFIQRVLYDDVDGPARLPFAVHVGPMASGSAVFRDEEVWQRLRGMGVRKVAALEMEAATIATVAHERRVPHWLVAKGVMDRADLTKDDRYKRFAARASAEVLYGLLGRLLPAVARSTAVNRTSPFPGTVKLDFCRRLGQDWPALADVVGVPSYARAQFGYGDEPRGVWEWLEVRGRLDELPAALKRIDRTDLIQ